ncbi:MAG: helix-turn-helix transcriptional regulator [Clostridia bacterium]|jgi:transcriptional regulator with XRE-family HTH domain|nr:helix-turn-helix transcriptional regulator [Clostridia bacterium]
MVNYGEALKFQREQQGISQSQLAREIGTSHQNVNRWEKGVVLPSIEFCIKLADYYEISLDELVGRDFIGQSRPTSFNAVKAEPPKPRMIPVAARSKGNKVRNLELSEDEIRKIQASRIKKADI